jgi:DNA processing protein
LLIKQGAKLVDCVQDIVEELPVQLEIVANSPIEKSSLTGEQTLDADYQHMLGYMGIDEPISIDALIERCQLSANTVSSMLLVLELQGQVTSQAGGLYMRRI